MTSSITWPVNGIKEPVSAKGNTEVFVILFWEECSSIDREVYRFNLRHLHSIGSLRTGTDFPSYYIFPEYLPADFRKFRKLSCVPVVYVSHTCSRVLAMCLWPHGGRHRPQHPHAADEARGTRTKHGRFGKHTLPLGWSKASSLWGHAVRVLSLRGRARLGWGQQDTLKHKEVFAVNVMQTQGRTCKTLKVSVSLGDLPKEGTAGKPKGGGYKESTTSWQLVPRSHTQSHKGCGD